MAKWITVAIVALLLFSAGLLAGHSVPFSKVLATVEPEKSDSRLVAGQQSAGDVAVESATSDGSPQISFVSHAKPVNQAELRTAELIEQGNVSDEHRSAVRNLIQRYFPKSDADAAEIWVETYAEMNLDEITFILEQKRLTSSELGTGFSIPSLSHSILSEAPASQPEKGTDVAIRIVESNLRGAYSLGFRRMVVFPEAPDNLESLTADDRRSTPVTSFRSFESGTLIRSPIATHVALSNQNSTMFCLEGKQLTRRGDFQILSDRRLGIITSSEEKASVESAPLPDDATNVRITTDGTIQYENAAGETIGAGRIAVCSITDLADLHSCDGVFYTASNTGNIVIRENASAFLLINTLEQSNVDRSYETSLLDYLKSLNVPTVESSPHRLK